MHLHTFLSALFTSSLFVTAASAQVCQPDLGFGGPGNSLLQCCGGPLTCGNTATITLSGAPPNAFGLLVLGTSQGATPMFGGTLVPTPITGQLTFTTDASGSFSLPITTALTCALSGPLFIQAGCVDPSLPGGVSISNAVRTNFFQGNQLHVGAGQPFGTIQSAIDSAVPGQQVVVHTGAYREVLDWHTPVDIIEATGETAL